MTRVHKSPWRQSTVLALLVLLPSQVCSGGTLLDGKSKESSAQANMPDFPESLATPTPSETLISNTVAAVSPKRSKPSEVVRSFYKYYLNGFPQPQKNKIKFGRFLTHRFLQEAIKADDYDPFLAAQDFDETFKNNFKISDAVISGQKATVELYLNGETFKWKRKIILKLEKGGWKIDGVKSLE